MDNYGSFAQDTLPVSSDSNLRSLGQRIDLSNSLYEFDLNYIEKLDLVQKNTHVFCEISSYMYLIIKHYNASYGYVMNQLVSSN